VRGWPGTTSVARRLWDIADQQTSRERVADYTQAIMDLGATVCVRAKPRCSECPLATDCVARAGNLTAVLPARKPAKALPTRRTILLWRREARTRFGRGRRPRAGVGAGLWSLPEAPDRASVRDPAALGGPRLQPDAFAELPAFVQGFSHYRLEATPLTVRL